jgi:ATP-dependent DNA helicase PIF1
MSVVFSINTRVTDEQKAIIRTVETGHNVFITGQAGTGKTFLVKEIYRRLKICGKILAVICSSGVAVSVYYDLNTSLSTVHSFYFLKTADLPWELVVERAISDNLVREQVKAVNVIIWDEVSMSSRCNFELVNAIH